MGEAFQEEWERSRGRLLQPLRARSLLSSQADTHPPTLQTRFQATCVPLGIGGRPGRSGEAGGGALPDQRSRRGEEEIYPTRSSPGSLLGSQVRSPAL